MRFIKLQNPFHDKDSQILAKKLDVHPHPIPCHSIRSNRIITSYINFDTPTVATPRNLDQYQTKCCIKAEDCAWQRMKRAT